MTTTATREDEWVSIGQAAEQLGVHPRTLRRYIRDQKLTVLRLSPQVVRIRPEDLDKFLDENIRIETGTGTCYVPRQEDLPRRKSRREVRPAAPARFSG